MKSWALAARRRFEHGLERPGSESQVLGHGRRDRCPGSRACQGPQLCQGHVPGIHPADEQAPLLGVEGAQEQVEDRRLASPRRPDQGHGLPRGHVEIELAQRWSLATVVAERYSLEADGERLQARRQGAGSTSG